MPTPFSDVRGFDDFRDLLKTRYLELKSRDPKFSHRYFCRAAGYGSSSAFGDILNGRRRLSQTGALRLSKSLQFTKSEAEYFLDLVNLNQAGSLEERNLFYARILTAREVRMETLERAQLEYFSHWYHAALRELLFFHPCKGDFRSLGRKLNPPVPAAQVRKAILLMEKLGLVARDAEGYYRQTSAFLTSDGGTRSLHVDNFKAETMRLAIEALDRHPRDQRDLSTLTATLSAESFEKAKAAVKALRQTILALAREDENVDRVVQVNLQLFPLTRIEPSA